MHIGIDATNLARDRRGMGRVARQIAGGLFRQPEARLTFLTRRDEDGPAIAASFAGMPVRVAPASAAVGRGAFDVVWLPFNGMTFRIEAPVVVTIHDAFAFTEPHREAVARWREQRPIRRAARNAARIVTDSFWSRTEIARELGVDPARVAVIPPAPDVFWSTGEGAAFPELGGRRAVVMVGAGERRKNARMLVDACAAALDPDREALALVGTVAPDVAAHAASRGVAIARIEADDERLRALYREAAVVAVPSLAEGFGLVAVEAMACGAPVIASSASALPEAAGGAALLVDPRDEAGWARAIRSVLDDGECAASLRARGIARAAAVDRDLPARELYAVFEAAVSERATR